MITSVRLRNFKNFENELLPMGRFSIILGTNASGKSNIRDAIRFLHGVGRGYSLAEIIGGRFGSGGQVEWEPIRGTAAELIRFHAEELTLEVTMRTSNKNTVYSLSVRATKDYRGGFRVTRESLKIGQETVYTSHPLHPDPVGSQDDSTVLAVRMSKSGRQRKYGNRVTVRPEQPAIGQLAEHSKVIRTQRQQVRQIMDLLANFRFLDLVPSKMRQPAFPGQRVLGDSGENLPTLLQQICANESRKQMLLEWLAELTPMDVADIIFQADPTSGLIQFAIQEQDGSIVSAYSVSDGTLRFLTILVALLGPEPPHLIFFEEIDNGLHPARMWLLVQFIEQQTAQSGTQVITTTHSPDLVAVANDNTLRSTSVVCRLPDSTNATILPILSLPDIESLRSSTGLGQLHSTGWMEDVVAFANAPTDSRSDRK